MFVSEGIRSGRVERAEDLDAPPDVLVGDAEVAERPVRHPEGVDADRLPGADAFAPRDLEPALDPRDGDSAASEAMPNSPMRCSARHCACGSPISVATS